jgi:hypothetical protein
MPQLVSYTKTATFVDGANLSEALDLGEEGGRLAGVLIPAGWTAADLTFQGSIDGTTFGNMYDKDGNEYTVKAAASRFVLLPIADFLGLRYLKIRSGTSGAPVTQNGIDILSLRVIG